MVLLQPQTPAPRFSGTAVVGGEFKEISSDLYSGKYLVLFFYPLDFTFVCPTEIIAYNDFAQEFRKNGCEVVACSTDSHFAHLAWINTPREQGGLGPMSIPLLSDLSGKISADFGVLWEGHGIAFRGLFIIDGSGIIRHISINDLPVGRSPDETLRLVQAFQFSDQHGEVCPAKWKPGQKAMKPSKEGVSQYLATMTVNISAPQGSASEKPPLKVVVTGAAGQIGYSLLYMIGSGSVFGSDQKVILHMLDITPCMGVLGGVAMELDDCALPCLAGVVATDSVQEAFTDIDAAFLVGAMPRREGMERKDLLAANVKIFKEQGNALDKFAKKNVKVLVVGNPANTNAFICSHYAPSIPKKNFSAMTRLDQNRAAAQIARKCGVAIEKVKNVIIWGNHSSTQFPDASHAVVDGKPAAELLDKAWCETEFMPLVQKRGAAVIAARKLSSAMSAAKAASDHMKDWFLGTKEGTWVSMAVPSDGSYDTPKDIVYSFPVTISNGEWTIVSGLPISGFAKEKMRLTAEELQQEKEEAEAVCKE